MEDGWGQVSINPGTKREETSTRPFKAHAHPRIEGEVDGGYVRDVGEIIDGCGKAV